MKARFAGQSRQEAKIGGLVYTLFYLCHTKEATISASGGIERLS